MRPLRERISSPLSRGARGVFPSPLVGEGQGEGVL